jgi:hypothetical protein
MERTDLPGRACPIWARQNGIGQCAPSYLMIYIIFMVKKLMNNSAAGLRPWIRLAKTVFDNALKSTELFRERSR